MADQPGFFDVDERYAALSAAGDPLERLSKVVNFEIFRPVLDAARVLSGDRVNPSGGDIRNPATLNSRERQDGGWIGHVFPRQG
jgi:hypothetical protein